MPPFAVLACPLQASAKSTCLEPPFSVWLASNRVLNDLLGWLGASKGVGRDVGKSYGYEERSENWLLASRAVREDARKRDGRLNLVSG